MNSHNRETAMRADIINGVISTMEAQGLDALVALSPENFAYLSGFVVPSHPIMRWRHAAYILTAEGDQAILSVDMEESTVNCHVNDIKHRSWGEFTDDPMVELAHLLADMGLSTARIGTELDYLAAGDFDRLGAALPEAKFSGAQDYLARRRQIKTSGELALMGRLARMADQAINTAFAAVNIGSSEMDIAGALTRTIYQCGADNFKLMIVATGERSIFPNVGPSARILRAGDICRVEIFAQKNGYHAGVCRTAYVQQTPPHAEKIWRNLDECKHIILDMIRPGASSREIYEAFISHLGKLDLPPIKFIGHGIGLHLHEEPYLGIYSDVELEAGMVLGIEPLVYDTGYGFGMQNKDIVAVTADGVDLLSNITDTKYLIKVT